MVERCGGSKPDGDFVHSLTLTDIASGSGRTECVAMRIREQMLVIEAFDKLAAELPFPMLGVGSGNHSAFMSQSVFDCCKGHGLGQTRSRACKKDDQAWVEQKNGAIVRRLVGYGRLRGAAATQALAQLYASSRDTDRTEWRVAPVSSCTSLAAFDRPGIPGRGAANPRDAIGHRCGLGLARGAPDRSRC